MDAAVHDEAVQQDEMRGTITRPSSILGAASAQASPSMERRASRSSNGPISVAPALPPGGFLLMT